jgi:hypothetical protein
MIKKLILIIGILLSTNVWTQVTTLSCESSEYLTFYNGKTIKSPGLASLEIKPETKEITFRSLTYDYKEVGNQIKFGRSNIDKTQTNIFSYTLDRISGSFTEYTSLIQTGGKDMGTFTKYKCVQAKPLF